MDDFVYWVWFQNAIDFGSFKAKFVLDKFGDLLSFYRAGVHIWTSLSLFSQKELTKLCLPLESFSKIVSKCNYLGYSIITLQSDNYPFLLKQINNPPLVLYAKGDISFLRSRCVSIVGSRRATIYGMQMAYEIARSLSKKGITIVSGGAVGADASAHRGALSSKGSTICVLACGIDYPYLTQNEALRNEIANSGLLISEYPPSFPIQSYNFSIRNRIVSGLSSCTIIVEAGKKSGSILTANIAAEQGRDVFVVPVKFESSLSEGINALISDGARVITCADDIYYYISNENHKNEGKNNIKDIKHKHKKRVELNLNCDEKKVLEIIKKKKMHINDIIKTTKLEAKKVSSIIVRLELMDLINSLPGKFYVIR